MKTKKQVIELHSALSSVVKSGNAKFKYAILKNLNVIASEIESIKTIGKEVDELLKPFNEKRNAIIVKFGTEDENGVVTIGKLSEKYLDALDEFKALEEEFKDDLEVYKLKMNEFDALTNEAVDLSFTFHEIAIENVPDTITDTEMKSLMDWEIVK